MPDREKVIDALEKAECINGVIRMSNQVRDIIVDLLKEQEPGWISVEECLPPERETIFAKLKGTDKWRPAMFTGKSDDVRIVIELEDGTRKVHHSYTVDGKWDIEKHRPLPCRVLYWMPNPPLPVPPKEVQKDAR